MPKVTFIGGNNVIMRGTEGEDRQFVFCPDENVPLIVDVAGVTPPNPKYYISRNCCDHHILIHVASGHGQCELNGKHYALNPSDTLIITPGSRNTYFPDAKDPFKLIWVNFFCDWFDDYLSRLGLTEHPVVQGVSCAEELMELVQLTKMTPNNDHLCFPAIRILCGICASLAEKVRFESRSHLSGRAVRIKDMLDECIYGKMDMEAIAARLYVSVSSVYREFQKSFGETPYQYVLSRKLALAKSLLARTDEPIATIAMRLAFADEFYFSNLFKKKTGMAPSAYRKMTRKLR